jgi:acetyl esterase/lipase
VQSGAHRALPSVIVPPPGGSRQCKTAARLRVSRTRRQRGGTSIETIAYAPPDPPGSEGHLLDLYLPPRSSGAAPVVLSLHGSAWLAENGRSGADLLAAELGPCGFAVAGVSTRSTFRARFPAQVHDVKAAIRWLRTHAGRYRLDAERIAVVGNSSGGWTAAMAGLTGGVPALEGDVGVQGPSSRVQAVIAFYPPTDFLQMDAHMLDGGAEFNAFLGVTGGHRDPRSPESRLVGAAIESVPERVREANPITYVTPAAPPFLILHGQRDPHVPYEQGVLLFDALAAAGAEATLVTLPHAGHGPWTGFLADPAVKRDAFCVSSEAGLVTDPRPADPTSATIVEFLHRSLGEAR